MREYRGKQAGTDPTETPGHETGFIVSVSPEDLRREKEKARNLRGSQWWKRQLARGICHYCQRRFPPGDLTMDHLVPLIRGGRSVRGNTVPACKECNNKKKYLLPIEWDCYLRYAAEDAARETEDRGKNPKGNDMEQCKECELAIYCYSESSSWIFRTKQEMEEKTAAMTNCPVRKEVDEARAPKNQKKKQRAV